MGISLFCCSQEEKINFIDDAVTCHIFSVILNLKMKIKLISLVIFSTLSVSSTARQDRDQRFIEEPRSVSVREGETVVLSCSVDNKMGVLQWTKDDFGLGTTRDLLQYSRYRMTGEEDREWNLEIV